MPTVNLALHHHSDVLRKGKENRDKFVNNTENVLRHKPTIWLVAEG